jgi:hypothetical protein
MRRGFSIRMSGGWKGMDEEGLDNTNKDRLDARMRRH